MEKPTARKAITRLQHRCRNVIFTPLASQIGGQNGRRGDGHTIGVYVCSSS
ncbi:MAG: hypothetical protein ACI9G1_002734, partial [Pirellulaceae bacterium]